MFRFQAYPAPNWDETANAPFERIVVFVASFLRVSMLFQEGRPDKIAPAGSPSFFLRRKPSRVGQLQ